MGIDVPDLDDREFEEIFETARRQIPVHTDEWTDHNTHDTGIAILRLLAWVSETYTYQLDRVSDDDRETYLDLLGVSRRPPAPSSASVAVSVPEDADGAVVPTGERLAVDDNSGVTKTFETSAETVLTAAGLERVLTNADDDTRNNTTENETENTDFFPFGRDPDLGDTLYLGFDGDPFAGADRLELTFEFADEDLPDPATHGDYESTFDPSVEVTWEHCLSYGRWDEDQVWASVPVVADETDSFYSGGRVTLGEPTRWDVNWTAVDGTQLHDQPSGLVWLRCRVENPGYEVPPQLETVSPNVLEVAHRETVENEPLRRDDDSTETTIESGQEFFFERAPVLDATVLVDGERWTAVEDLAQSGSHDKHYVLDRQRGAVVFGDGIDGSKPPVNAEVIAREYVHGGGTAGNVSGAAEWEFEREDGRLGGTPLSEVPLTPLGPATGGRNMESIADAMNRFKRDLAVPYRASTLEDYRYVAKHTPGLRVGRTEATSEPSRAADASGGTEIRVVVAPYGTGVEPRPSRGFLEAVEDHLNRCRLVTDEVRVLPPTYVSVGVDARVSAFPDSDDQALRRRIGDEIQSYLHPISGYDGTGWPFGRQLSVADVENVVESVSGVKSVEETRLTASGDAEIDEFGNVIIDDTSLFSASKADVSVSVDGRGGRP